MPNNKEKDNQPLALRNITNQPKSELKTAEPAVNSLASNMRTLNMRENDGFPESLRKAENREASSPVRGSGKRPKAEKTSQLAVQREKEVDFSKWYRETLQKGGMLEPYEEVSGCFILKPNSFFIWEEIQRWFNKKLTRAGIDNCSFPMFVSQKQLEVEKAHIEGFAPELAWVTHAGEKELANKFAIRPTSETIIYPYYAKWIRSHRDLPLRLNLWNTVVRWETKNSIPFLRAREFHWQEGHTAHLTKELADKEVRQILGWYEFVYTELLAVPVVAGTKTEREKFAGSLYTTTVEGYIPDTGRGIQGATSHCLGQHFSKMFDISVEDPSTKEGGVTAPRVHVWQNSWGLSTRAIGVMVMVHGDTIGLVIPPRVAKNQIIMVPVGTNKATSEDDIKKVENLIDRLLDDFLEAEIRAIADKRDDVTSGWKVNEWEQKGVPLRLEIGPAEMRGGYVTASRRDRPGKDNKFRIQFENLVSEVKQLFSRMHDDMLSKATKQRQDRTQQITEWKSFVPALNKKNICMIPFCLTEKCEEEIKESTTRESTDDSTLEDAGAPSMGAKSLCIPFDQPGGLVVGQTKCLNPNCTSLAQQWCLFGRSY